MAINVNKYRQDGLKPKPKGSYILAPSDRTGKRDFVTPATPGMQTPEIDTSRPKLSFATNNPGMPGMQRPSLTQEGPLSMRAQSRPAMNNPGMPGMIQPTPETGMTQRPAIEQPQSWVQAPFMGNMNTGDFVSLAGALGHAIAPDTPMGRAGGVMSQYAGQEKARLASIAAQQAEIDKEHREYQQAKDLEDRRTRLQIAKEIFSENMTNKKLESAEKRSAAQILASEEKQAAQIASAEKIATMRNDTTMAQIAAIDKRASAREDSGDKITIKDQKTISDDIKEHLYSQSGYAYDKDLHKYTNADGEVVTQQQLAEINKQAKEVSAEVIKLVDAGWLVDDATIAVQSALERLSILKQIKEAKDLADKEKEAKDLAAKNVETGGKEGTKPPPVKPLPASNPVKPQQPKAPASRQPGPSGADTQPMPLNLLSPEQLKLLERARNPGFEGRSGQ